MPFTGALGALKLTLNPEKPPDHSRSSIGGRRLTREASRAICCFASDSSPPAKNPGYAIVCGPGRDAPGHIHDLSVRSIIKSKP